MTYCELVSTDRVESSGSIQTAELLQTLHPEKLDVSPDQVFGAVPAVLKRSLLLFQFFLPDTQHVYIFPACGAEGNNTLLDILKTALFFWYAVCQ